MVCGPGEGPLIEREAAAVEDGRRELQRGAPEPRISSSGSVGPLSLTGSPASLSMLSHPICFRSTHLPGLRRGGTDVSGRRGRVDSELREGGVQDGYVAAAAGKLVCPASRRTLGLTGGSHA